MGKSANRIRRSMGSSDPHWLRRSNVTMMKAPMDVPSEHCCTKIGSPKMSERRPGQMGIVGSVDTLAEVMSSRYFRVVAVLTWSPHGIERETVWNGAG